MYKNAPNVNLQLPHEYNTRRRDDLNPQYQRLGIFQQSVDYQAPSLWNRIPIYIRNSNSVRIFKRRNCSNITYLNITGDEMYK